MGYPRRRRVATLGGWATAALMVLLASCSGGHAQVQDLLLHPGDFPGLAVAATTVEVSETADGQPAAQVELSGTDFEFRQSIVMFETGGEVRSILAGIKGAQLAQGVSPMEPGGFQDVSGVLAEQRSDGEALTLFFAQGRALVRVTISGPNRRALLPVYAEKARSKVDRQ